jgi:hypothetical protein
MVIALGTDVQVFFDLFGVDDLAAVLTLGPKPLGNPDFFLFLGRKWCFLILEKAHARLMEGQQPLVLILIKNQFLLPEK